MNFIHKIKHYKLETFILAVFFVCLFLIANNVRNYGFWWHDCWAYTNSEFDEFSASGRWMATIFHFFIHYIPPFFAWILDNILVYCFIYIFLKRFYFGTKYNPYVLYLLPFFILLSYPMQEQLNWPLHTLSVLIVLSLGAYFTKKRESLTIMSIVILLSFPILQSYSFIALFLSIPSLRYFLNINNNRKFIRIITNIMFVWFGSIVLAYLISKLIQFIYFGRLVPIASWRHPKYIHNSHNLINNITSSYLSFLELFESYSYYCLIVLITIIYLFFIIYVYSTRSKTVARASTFIFICALLVTISSYLITLPIGTRVPFRAAHFGFGIMLLYVAIDILGYSARKHQKKIQFFIVIIFSVIVAKSSLLSYYNSLWAMQVTNDVKNAINETRTQDIKTIDKIVISIKSKDYWKLSYDDLMNGYPLFLSGFISLNNHRIKRAFDELGYKNKIEWCDNNLTNSEDCQKINNMIFPKCSTINTDVCGLTVKSIWYIDFK